MTTSVSEEHWPLAGCLKMIYFLLNIKGKRPKGSTHQGELGVEEMTGIWSESFRGVCIHISES